MLGDIELIFTTWMLCWMMEMLRHVMVASVEVMGLVVTICSYELQLI
jgi:hypothetical protein